MLIAVDFDGTIVEEAYPNIGKPIPFAIDVLKKLIDEQHHQLILWTVREGKLLEDAVEYCKSRGVEFYAINKLHPDLTDELQPRKIAVDIFIDDRNIGGLPDWGLIHRMIMNKEDWSSVFEHKRETSQKKRDGFFKRLFSQKKLNMRLLCTIVAVVSLFNSAYAQRNGIYHSPDRSMSITFSSGVNYYFGDIEEGGFFSKNAKNQMNLYLQTAISFKVADILALRANLVGGKMSGNKTLYSFESTFIEPDFIVEYYPLEMDNNKVGLFVFGGIGVVLGKIDFDDKQYGRKNQNVYMPIVPLGVGYKYTFAGSGLQLGVEFGSQLALVDNAKSNLDAYPFLRGGKYIKGGESKWFDGYYKFGVLVGWFF